MSKKQERPTVKIEALTANTVGIKIVTENGDAWIVATHDGIRIEGAMNIEVRS